MSAKKNEVPVSESPAATDTATDAAAAAEPVVEVVRGERVFRVAGAKIRENETTAGLSNEEVREVLKGMYPEVANATIRESVKDGVSIVEFLPQPGRKG